MSSFQVLQFSVQLQEKTSTYALAHSCWDRTKPRGGFGTSGSSGCWAALGAGEPCLSHLIILNSKCRTGLEAQCGVSTGELWYSLSMSAVSASSLNGSTHSQVSKGVITKQKEWLEKKVVYYIFNVESMNSYTKDLALSYGLYPLFQMQKVGCATLQILSWWIFLCSPSLNLVYL